MTYVYPDATSATLATPNPMNYVRTSNGDTVPQGVLVSETALGRIWRWPLRFVPKALVENPALAVVVAVLPFGVWGIAGWLIWRKVKTRF